MWKGVTFWVGGYRSNISVQKGGAVKEVWWVTWARGEYSGLGGEGSGQTAFVLHWCVWFSQCVSLYLQLIRTVPQQCGVLQLYVLCTLHSYSCDTAVSTC